MKALDLQTKTYHKVVSLNYDTNTVVLESPEYGRTSNTLDNVRLIPDTKEDLKGKTIIHPDWFWIIPFVGWFMVPYKLFTIEDCVIEAKSVKDQLIMNLAAIGPILLFTFFVYLSVS